MCQVKMLTKHIAIMKRAKENQEMSKAEIVAIIDVFMADVYRFIKQHKELELTEYQRTLSENKISWGEEVEVSTRDKKCVLAIIVGIIRADHFSEGIVVHYVRDGYLLKCLERLEELDQTL